MGGARSAKGPGAWSDDVKRPRSAERQYQNRPERGAEFTLAPSLNSSGVEFGNKFHAVYDEFHERSE